MRFASAISGLELFVPLWNTNPTIQFKLTGIGQKWPIAVTPRVQLNLRAKPQSDLPVAVVQSFVRP